MLYIGFTVTVTEWRSGFRRAMNEQDSKANTKALDALLNYETVKYFSNEPFEQARYDDNLHRLEKASVKSQTSLSVLNLGQSLIIATAVTLLVWRATLGVVAGTMTLGDLVLVNALMIQLYIPLNFLGVHLPRDQAVDDRHGEDVRPARPAPRDRRRAGGAAAATGRGPGSPAARCASRTCASATTATARSCTT